MIVIDRPEIIKIMLDEIDLETKSNFRHLQHQLRHASKLKIDAVCTLAHTEYVNDIIKSKGDDYRKFTTNVLQFLHTIHNNQ